MSIVVFLMAGFMVGLVARALTPGLQAMAVWKAIGLGLVGALTGGLLSSVFEADSRWLEIQPMPLVFAIVGAIIVVLMAEAMFGARVEVTKRRGPPLPPARPV